MKKIIISVFIISFLLSIYGCGLNLEKESKNLTEYIANLTYQENDHTVMGNLLVNYVNNSNSTLDYIKFNIYANAFREGSQQNVISLSKYNDCYYNGKSYGGIEINKVYINNTELNYSICGVDNNILKVNLLSNLQPEKSTSFSLDIKITLPNISHRFGYGKNTINLGNFLPTACVFENGNWKEIEYQSNGDPFYSEVANYQINLTYNKDFVLASSGVCIQTEENENNKTSHLVGKAIRDFAIVLSKKFSVVSKMVNNIKVNYFYYDDNNFEQSLNTSCRAIQTFSDLFGKYPYEEISVVQANFCIGGMEFPNIVLIGDEIDDYDEYCYVIVHEIAHQWWYGVVGNNQTDYAWLDEGLAEYSSALFYKKNTGYNYTYEKLISKANTTLNIYQQVYTKIFGGADTTMNRSLKDYYNETEYVYTAYIKGFLLFDSLSDLISEKVVVKCLKNYYTTYGFKISTPAHLIASFEKTTSCNLEGFFNCWINGKVVSVH